MTEITERVARGVALLDEKVPNWREHVDTDRLDMNRTFHNTNIHGYNGCLLAQLNAADVLGNAAAGYGHYSSALNVLLEAEGISPYTDLSNEFAIKHGFDVSRGSEQELSELHDAWIEVI